MFKLFEPQCRVCGEIGQDVSVDQTEQECRAQHDCRQAVCPLRSSFKPQRFDETAMRNRTA